jgi:CubicO group peptidase (beta-lactamase class C family)
MKQWKTDGVVRLVASTLAALAVIGSLQLARAGELAPAAGSFSREGLARVGDYIRDEIAAGKIPGAVLLIQQHGKPVYFESFGVRDVATKLPMTPDTIFRLYSMSKPITSVAAMMLVEDGKLKLDDPVSKYIPAFAKTKVGVEKRGEDGALTLVEEPLDRPITIIDLLRHTSGLPYAYTGAGLVRARHAEAALARRNLTNAEFAEQIAKVPLVEQPGTRWDYGYSTDVLGRVIEVASGKSLFEFEKERLLGPLGMRTTMFTVNDPNMRPWVAEPMPADRAISPVTNVRDPLEPRRMESGGGGMVGTIGDYARFAQMLLNGGTFDGRTYLKPQTIALMASDHIGPETKIKRDYAYYPGETSGFGLGFAVRTSVPPNTSWPLGEYRWDGVAGTFFFIDPRDDMFAICMIQTPSQRGRIQLGLKTLIYQALER